MKTRLSAISVAPSRSRRRICAFLLGTGLMLPALSVRAQSAGDRKSFIMGSDSEPEHYLNRLSVMLYAEIFKRLHLPWEMLNYPLARRSVLLEQGAIDGEAGRVYAYGAQHPELVRVEESLLDFTFSVYTASPALTAARLEDLPATARVEYRRGILICENALKKAIPADRLSDVGSTDQGIKKLAAGRTDVYCEIDGYISEALRAPEFKSVPGVSLIRKLFDIGSLPIYPYLAKKHADLAPRMAAVMQQMKAEGLFTAYRKQLNQQLGVR